MITNLSGKIGICSVVANHTLGEEGLRYVDMSNVTRIELFEGAVHVIDVIRVFCILSPCHKFSTANFAGIWQLTLVTSDNFLYLLFILFLGKLTL